MVQPAAVTQPSPSTTSPLPWCTSCTTLSTISGQLIFGLNFSSIFMIFSDLYRSQIFLIWNWIFSSILQNRPIVFNLLYKIYCIWYIIFHNIFRSDCVRKNYSCTWWCCVEGICFSQTIEMSTKSFPVILVAAVFFALYLFTNDKTKVEEQEHITTEKPEVVYQHMS